MLSRMNFTGNSALNNSIILTDPSVEETCATLVNASFTYGLNGLDVRCRMNHTSFSDEDRQAFQDKVTINILCNHVAVSNPSFSSLLWMTAQN